MANAQNSNQDPQTNVVHHNHSCKIPTTPRPSNNKLCFRNTGRNYTRSFSKRNPAQVPYTPDYINQIIPLLQTLCSQSARWVLLQGGIPPPASNTIYLPPAYRDLQKLLSELSSVQSSTLGMMAHL